MSQSLASLRIGVTDVLVLTRKMGEGISIGDDIKIVVMNVRGKQVRLGIKAPSTTTVHREEIYQKIIDENVKASDPVSGDLDEAQKLFKESTNMEGVIRRSPLKRHVRPSDD